MRYSKRYPRARVLPLPDYQKTEELPPRPRKDFFCEDFSALIISDQIREKLAKHTEIQKDITVKCVKVLYEEALGQCVTAWDNWSPGGWDCSEPSKLLLIVEIGDEWFKVPIKKFFKHKNKGKHHLRLTEKQVRKINSVMPSSIQVEVVILSDGAARFKIADEEKMKDWYREVVEISISKRSPKERVNLITY